MGLEIAKPTLLCAPAVGISRGNTYFYVQHYRQPSCKLLPEAFDIHLMDLKDFNLFLQLDQIKKLYDTFTETHAAVQERESDYES